MADPKINQKLLTLAERVKKSNLSPQEQIRLLVEFDTSQRPVEERVTKSIAASLYLTENDVHTKLASYDDNDSIIDDINDILDRK